MRMSPFSVALILALGACSGDKDGTGTTDTPDTTDTGTPGTGLVSDFTVEPGPIAGVMVATLTTSEEATVRLAYGLEGEALATEHPDSSTGTSHSFTVLGVKTGKNYDFQAIVDVAGDVSESTVVTSRVAAADTSVPLFELRTWEEELACQSDGYVLLSYLGNNNSGVAILDRDGEVVWALPFKNTNIQLARVRPSLDGSSLIYTTADGDRIEEIGEHVKLSLDGNTSETLSTPRSHHDFVELPDSTIAWLDFTPFQTYDNCSKGTALPDPTQDVALDAIAEAQFGGTPTTVYDMFADYTRPLNCDVDDEDFLAVRDVFDLSHSNSIAYRESDNAYFHMSRWHDAFYKVDRATGALVWEFGGQHNDFTPVKGQDPTEIFNHSHMSEIWDDGMLIFNNNDFGPNYPDSKGPSEVHEYALDETAMTWERVWSWESDKGFEQLLGDARRIPPASCDNLIVSLSGSGIVREITRDGEFAWAVSAPLGNVTGRVYFLPDIYDLTSAIHE